MKDGALMSESVSIVRYDAGAATNCCDDVAREEPLEIRVRGRAVSVTMRTPGHDSELALGFLLTEGIIRSHDEVRRVEACRRDDGGDAAGNLLNVQLAPMVAVDFDRLTRHVFASSSCGLCGKATIDAIRGMFPKAQSAAHVDAQTLLLLPQKMQAAQTTFSRTGGLHAAALFTTSGDLIVLREDVGRHNAVDKVLGFCLARNLLPLNDHILLVSGRTSFEILQKALAASLPIVVAVSAPSSLAVAFATDAGQTLVGFLRQARMNIYSYPQRIRGLALTSNSPPKSPLG